MTARSSALGLGSMAQLASVAVSITTSTSTTITALSRGEASKQIAIISPDTCRISTATNGGMDAVTRFTGTEPASG
jgi:hypothetical protein